MRTVIYHGKPSGSLADPAGSVFHCSRCQQLKPVHVSMGGTGYAVTAENTLKCYRCCGQTERLHMLETGRATLYLSKDNGAWIITDWPGELRFPVYYVRPMNHPFAEARIAYFTGPDGKRWSAKNIGDMQIAHCRRLKKAVD